MIGNPLVKSIIAVALGAVLGALLRWQLNTRLDSLFPAIPPGTLVANLIGAYIVGMGIAFLAHAKGISPEWRLFIITGFCGSLTTFSTFSVEVAALLQHGRIHMAFGAVAMHVLGSLAMTFAGMGTIHLVKGYV